MGSSSPKTQRLQNPPLDSQSFEKHQNNNQIATDAALATLKGLLLVNGGAAVSVLGLATNPSKNNGAGAAALAGSVMYFAWGVAFVILAMAGSYGASFFLAEDIRAPGTASGKRLLCFGGSILLVLGALALFLAGCYNAKNAVFSFV